MFGFVWDLENLVVTFLCLVNSQRMVSPHIFRHPPLSHTKRRWAFTNTDSIVLNLCLVLSLLTGFPLHWAYKVWQLPLILLFKLGVILNLHIWVKKFVLFFGDSLLEFPRSSHLCRNPFHLQNISETTSIYGEQQFLYYGV